MPQILITTVPFADRNGFPLEMLEGNGVDYRQNPLNRKLTEDELTELITEKALQTVPRLKHISRVGIGLENVDLLAAERRGIKVFYTPAATQRF